MARGNNIIGALSNFIKRHPKTSAAIAFNLGLYAAAATKQGKAATRDLKKLPGKLIDMVPSMDEINRYVSSREASARKSAGKVKRKVAKKAAKRAKSAKKAASRKKRR